MTSSAQPPDRQAALEALARAAYSLSAADARLRGRATRTPGALSLTHARALRVLAERGPLSIAELAAGVETTSPAATQLVNGLARAGYVDRRPDPANRRAVRVSLTPEGRERHRSRERALSGALDTALAELGGQDITVATEVLIRLGAIYDEL
ncbi:MarR family winged helix-turn-helix transcriptional regulator [Streptomyces sp. NPDC090106]|uniref:MarR family winged helix-turn-helix transcriptional regulator n=1 Tax=Streptomyces sp. NPDC090106 TaxID=3365946 RepID=UPI0037F445FC